MYSLIWTYWLLFSTINRSFGESQTFILMHADKLIRGPPHESDIFVCANTTFLCMGVNAPVLFEWFVNGSAVVEYTYRDSHSGTFPRNNPFDGYTSITAKICNVNRVDVVGINISSALTGNFQLLYGSSLSCGSDIVRSNSYRIFPKGRHGPMDANIAVVFHDDTRGFIVLKWNVNENECPDIVYTYEVKLTGSANTSRNVAVKCTAECRVEFIISLSNEHYQVVIRRINEQGKFEGEEYVSAFIGRSNFSRPTATTVLTFTDISSGQGNTIIIAASVAAVILVITIISAGIIILVWCRKNSLFKTKKCENTEKAVYDEIPMKKHQQRQEGRQTLQDDGIETTSNECYGRIRNDSINLKECVAYSTHK